MAGIKCWYRVVLCGLAAFSFGAIAEEQPSANQQPKWGPHIDADAKLGNLRNFGEADLFIPVTQNSDTLVFGDLRGRFDDHSGNEGNLGLGMRHMLPSGWNLGVYGFWDRRRSNTGNLFHQWTLGAEALGRDWDFRANGYIPQGNRVRSLGTTGGVSTAAISGGIVQITTAGSTTREERALGGYDAEVGWRTPLFAAEDPRQLRFYLGGYHFSDSVAKVSGPRLRAQFDMAQVPGLWRGAQLFVDAEAQDDSVRGGQQFLGFRLRIPLGGEMVQSRQLNWQERRMTAPLVRDVDIVTETRVTASTPAVVETAITTGGQAITVLNSATTTGAALPGAVAAAGANSTVILSGTFNTTATTTLQSGQTVIGSGSLAVKSASGHTATLALTGATVNATIGGVGPAAANPGFMMANNSTLDGLNVSLTRSGGVGTIAVYFTNVSGATIRNSTVTATETGANAADGVVVGDATSSITVSGNTISAAAQLGQSASAFLLVNGGGGAAATVTGNTLSATGGTNNWVVFLNGGTFNAGSTGNVKSAGTCHSLGGTGVLYFTDSTTCP